MTKKTRTTGRDNAELRFTLDDFEETRPIPTRTSQPITDAPPGAVIKVVGVGGGGGNAVNRMIAAGVEGVEFIAVNTDCQALAANRAPVKIQIGQELTRGLGSGAKPQVGREAALEDTERLIEALSGADMIFVTTGLGGGTGTGASPIIAGLAAELDALVVAVVTKPFSFEGRRRRQQAEEGLLRLRESVDTVVTIPNDKLLHTVDRNTSVPQAFMMADEVLRGAVQGISDLILTPGDINRDFADVRTVMKGMGMALMGTGISEGENRAVEAAQQAISSPLLEDASIEGARGVIFNITGGEDFGLHEMNDAASIIEEAADPDATILLGYATRPEMNGRVKVTVIATGFDGRASREAAPQDTRQVERLATPPAAAFRLHDEPSSRQESLGLDEAPAPIIAPAPVTRLEDLVFPDDGMPPHLDSSERENLDIPAYLRRAQD